ncbi:MAG: hypothetical protein JW836_16265 [Deltaproteobacteria bacterium]|nr:hypothetical protein [Deltaproteobacteria bacterium]
MKKAIVVIVLCLLFPIGGAAEEYDWYVVFPYYAKDNYWWTGIAVFCGIAPASFSIAVFDSNGDAVANGEFALTKQREQKVDLLENFFGGAAIPACGSIYIFATNHFEVSMFMGNSSGGFSFVNQTAKPYQ